MTQRTNGHCAARAATALQRVEPSRSCKKKVSSILHQLGPSWALAGPQLGAHDDTAEHQDTGKLVSRLQHGDLRQQLLSKQRVIGGGVA